MLFAVLMLSAVSVFAQIVVDREYGIEYNFSLEKVVGYTNSILSKTYIGDLTHSSLGSGLANRKLTIESSAFSQCDKLTEVTIGECIIAIEGSAFRNCTNLTKVSIPTTVTTIGDKAFQGCSSLTELTIPEGVTTIGEDAFKGCTNLTNVSIPESVTSIGADAFKGTKCFLGITHKETNNSVTVSDIPDQTYTGAAIEPEITVLDKRTALALTLGTDYTIRYISNIESGNATVIITGIGDYEGMEIKSFDIKSKALVASNVSDIPDQTFTGSRLKPSVTVKDGNKTLELETDYTVSYTNNTNVGTATATIRGKGNYSGKVEKTFTIKPSVVFKCGALTLTEDQNGKTATLDGAYTGDASLVIDEDRTVNFVTFNRTFTPGATSTIILPFAVTSGNYSGGTFYEFQSVDYENGKWVASLTKVADDIAANKPYLFVPSGDKLTITGGVTLTATFAEEYADNKGDWSFKGVYKVKDWETGVKTDYFFASASATSTAGNAVNAGDFVRIGNECHLNPFRCYLSYSGSDQSLSKSAKELPTSIEVRLIDEVASVVEPNENPSESGEIITPVSEITPDSGIKVWSFGGTVIIEAQSNTDYTIVDLSGRTLKNGITHSTRETVTLSRRAAGIVIVKIGNKTFKVNY